MDSTELLDDSIQAKESNRNENHKKIDLPYANNVRNTGIASIVAVLSVIGFMLGLYLLNVCLKRAKESYKSYNDFPGNYHESSLKRVQIGRILGLIALSIWILEIALFLMLF